LLIKTRIAEHQETCCAETHRCSYIYIKKSKLKHIEAHSAIKQGQAQEFQTEKASLTADKAHASDNKVQTQPSVTHCTYIENQHAYTSTKLSHRTHIEKRCREVLTTHLRARRKEVNTPLSTYIHTRKVPWHRGESEHLCCCLAHRGQCRHETWVALPSWFTAERGVEDSARKAERASQRALTFL
jgi:hypothetical protein